MKTIQCLRCNIAMQHVMDTKFQLGQTGWLLGDWPNLLAGALEAAVYTCPNCGKIELFQLEPNGARDAIAKRQCPHCGKWHDMDDPKCPFCKYKYE